jgi:hypothetical protein
MHPAGPYRKARRKQQAAYSNAQCPRAVAFKKPQNGNLPGVSNQFLRGRVRLRFLNIIYSSGRGPDTPGSALTHRVTHGGFVCFVCTATQLRRSKGVSNSAMVCLSLPCSAAPAGPYIQRGLADRRAAAVDFQITSLCFVLFAKSASTDALPSTP